jgi:glycosyltransferase involved in cell wall biosynthesis
LSANAVNLKQPSTYLEQLPELTVVMPCLNEARTLGDCIRLIQSTVSAHNIVAEVLVADNGSTDGSIEIAESLGARVVHIETKGYGNALRGGIEVARGKFVIMGDSDMSYDFGDIPKFVEQLRNGADLAMGNRFLGGIKPNAMPVLHKYLGNPGLTAIGRLFFHATVNDFYCGLRGFRKTSYQAMGLRTTGMEFALEMVVKASVLHMNVTELPTTLSPDGRDRRPHLKTWRDGWRSLRFFLLYSPRWLFYYPGLLLMIVGLAVCAWLIPGPRQLYMATLDAHTLLYAAGAVILGFQSVVFAVFTKFFAIAEGLLPEDPRLTRAFRYITLETGVLTGLFLFLCGLAMSVSAFHRWSIGHFGPLDYSSMLRRVIPALLALILGGQIIFSSFFMSVLGLKRR